MVDDEAAFRGSDFEEEAPSPVKKPAARGKKAAPAKTAAKKPAAKRGKKKAVSEDEDEDEDYDMDEDEDDAPAPPKRTNRAATLKYVRLDEVPFRDVSHRVAVKRQQSPLLGRRLRRRRQQAGRGRAHSASLLRSVPAGQEPLLREPRRRRQRL